MSDKSKNIIGAVVCILVLALCVLLLFGFIRNKITTGSFISFTTTEHQEDLQVKDLENKMNFTK